MPFTVIILSCLTSLIIILLLFPRGQGLWVPYKPLLHQCLAQCLTGLGAQYLFIKEMNYMFSPFQCLFISFIAHSLNHPMNYPMPEVRGGSWEEQPQVAQVQVQPTLKFRRGREEEIILIQGKEQWLRFAGAAVKIYPMSKVRETQVRW